MVYLISPPGSATIITHNLQQNDLQYDKLLWYIIQLSYTVVTDCKLHPIYAYHRLQYCICTVVSNTGS